jgi:dihydrofolate reductase
VESPEKWHFPWFNDEMGEIVESQMAASDTMLLGRRTYQEFAAYWPDKAGVDPFAEKMNGTPKLVASTTLDRLDWQNSTLIRGNVAEELTKLKQDAGEDISITGSATLVRSLLRDDVLDELRPLVHPIVVGERKRLFEGGLDQEALELTDLRVPSTGVLYLTYAPAPVQQHTATEQAVTA